MRVFRKAAERPSNPATVLAESTFLGVLLRKEGVVHGCPQMRFEGCGARDQSVASGPEAKLNLPLLPGSKFLLFAAHFCPTPDRDKFQKIPHSTDREPVIAGEAVVDRGLQLVLRVEHDRRHSLAVGREPR